MAGIAAEVAKWALGALAIGMLLMTYRQEQLIDTAVRVHELALENDTVHSHPDDFGFGTRELTRMLEEATESTHDAAEASQETSRQLRALNHYMRQVLRQQTGTEPDPYIEGG